jgi:hypothetical protein
MLLPTLKCKDNIKQLLGVVNIVSHLTSVMRACGRGDGWSSLCSSANLTALRPMTFPASMPLQLDDRII